MDGKVHYRVKKANNTISIQRNVYEEDAVTFHPDLSISCYCVIKNVGEEKGVRSPSQSEAEAEQLWLREKLQFDTGSIGRENVVDGHTLTVVSREDC